MRRFKDGWGKSAPALFLLLVVIRSAHAQDGGPPAQEALTRWEWFADVLPPDANPAARWLDFVVSPGVFDKARADLGDLRLYDGNGREVPYDLRVRRAQDTQQPLSAKEFNRTTLPDRAAELSLDLGENTGEHNQIVVITDGDNFRRRLLVEAGDDGKTWQTLLDKVYLVHFRVGDQLIDVRRFTFPVSRYRYLRVRVYPDASLEDDAPSIRSVEVSRSIQVPGEDVTLPATLGGREPVPADGGPGSAWTIDLGARVRCERLLFDVADNEFTRTYRLETDNPDEPRQFLQSGEWRRRAGEEQRPLEIRFNEVQARRLRLVVTDFRNPPLGLMGVRYAAPARQIVFSPPEAGAPLKLYFGNPDAGPPHYDFAAALPARLDPPPVRATLGEVALNPAYRPTPPPWSERWPWLVYVVLGAASLVLLAVLIALGREAVRRHDQAAPLAA